MKTVTKTKKVVKTMSKPIKQIVKATPRKNALVKAKIVARNDNIAQSTWLRNQHGSFKEGVSTHAYEIVNVIKNKRLDSIRTEVQFKILNVDTQNILTKKGIYYHNEYGDFYILKGALEGFTNIAIMSEIPYNTPCDIVQKYEELTIELPHEIIKNRFVLIPIDNQKCREMLSKSELRSSHFRIS